MIYICIPVHEERRTVGVLLWKIRKVMADFGRDYEILLMDDASNDGTSEALESYRALLPLSVFRKERRAGYAVCLEDLLREAVRRAPYPKRDAVVTIQGDFTESPDYIVPLVKAFEGGADVVVGSVESRSSDAPRAVRLARWLAPLAIGGVARGLPVSDPLSGFRAYRVVVLKKLFRDGEGKPLLTARGWAANVELLGKVVPHARRIDETPIDLRYDGRVRKSRVRAIATVRDLMTVRGRVAAAPSEEKAG